MAEGTLRLTLTPSFATENKMRGREPRENVPSCKESNDKYSIVYIPDKVDSLIYDEEGPS